MNPLLLDNRKFDIRCYMLIASAVPLLVLYRRGYCRLSIYEYDNSSGNITAHLTNQKRDPKYSELKEETAWNMDQFNDYINESVAPVKGLPQDWVYEHLDAMIQQTMLHCVHAVKYKLHCKVGYFDLYGFDFMIDEDMKVWLIEVNVNPCLATNCAALKEAIPEVVRESIHLSIECFEKARRGRPLKPLQALREFRVIYDGSSKCSSGVRSPTRTVGQTPSDHRPKLQSPVRRARSLSPLKEPAASRDTTRAKATTSTVPKSTSAVYTAQSKEKRPLLGTDACVRSNAETTSTTRLRQGRKTKEVSDCNDSGLHSTADETTKAPSLTNVQAGLTPSSTAPTSTKLSTTARQHGSSKEPQFEKRRAAETDITTDENANEPSRGS